MTNITLNFINRVKLAGILSTARGGEGGFEKLHSLLKVFDHVRFTEAELGHMVVTDLGGGVVNYKIKDRLATVPEFAAKTVKVEDQQAKWLLKEVEAWVANATIEDLQWLDPLLAQLKKGKSK